MNGKFKNIDEYLSRLSADKRAALEKVRRAIGAAAPDAEETISYGMPAFRLDGRPLVYFAAHTNHCSLYPASRAVIRAHSAELKAFETSAGTIRFPAANPLPSALIKKIVKARVAELRKAC
jgi:uncharacterized protein YdhG (YjbR/CyaY superfamily)